jgi:hypothetical protein
MNAFDATRVPKTLNRTCYRSEIRTVIEADNLHPLQTPQYNQPSRSLGITAAPTEAHSNDKALTKLYHGGTWRETQEDQAAAAAELS